MAAKRQASFPQRLLLQYEGRPQMAEAVWKQHVPHGSASNFGAVDEFSNIRKSLRTRL